MTILSVHEPSLIVLCGPAGSGKSTFARRCFAPSEIVSADAIRAMICDDPAEQRFNDDVFEVLHRIVELRLRLGRLTVVDATNLEPHARLPLRRLARQSRLPTHLVVIDAPLALTRERNAGRERRVEDGVLRQDAELLARLDDSLAQERWDRIDNLDAGPLDAVRVQRAPLPPVRFDAHGPFDIIGDVHGCASELHTLLEQLGYGPDGRHPEGRTLVLVGDLVDRGPDSVGVLRLVLSWIEHGRALFVPGNHDEKLNRWLEGRAVKVHGGLSTTVAEWQDLTVPEERLLRERFQRAMDAAPPYLWLDDGKLLVSHAGLEEQDHGRVGDAVRAFCLFGKTTGKVIDGLPERLDWAADYRGAPAVVHGHVPVKLARWRNGVADIDLGVVFGGRLCAVRWPERTFLSVPAEKVWWGAGRWGATEPPDEESVAR